MTLGHDQSEHGAVHRPSRCYNDGQWRTGWASVGRVHREPSRWGGGLSLCSLSGRGRCDAVAATNGGAAA
jgi:hypothetical protein